MKRKWGVAEILLGALLTVAVFAVGYSVASASHLAGNEAGGEKQQQISNFADILVAVWNYLTKDAITLFTLVLAGATWLLWRSTDKLWKVTKDDWRTRAT